MEKENSDSHSWEKKTKKVISNDSLHIRIAQGVGNAMMRLKFDPTNLLIHISNKLKILDWVIEKEKTFFGRLSNKIMGEELECVSLDGIVIKQLYEVVGKNPPMEIDLNASYKINHSTIRDLYDSAEKIINSKIQ
ncbi:MAG: hypothetical protein HON65_01130 [Rhodospirillales bacterium]|jgi:hypothetical protein|nr:hypothetical protein [Rhodospirillales bacterium]